ncbi:MAG: lysylphosphatidylglycerol synthase transmembrane domain-containing protein, partial [Litorilinea sp.]
SMSNGQPATLLRWIQPLFLIAAGIFIVYLIGNQWGELRAYPWRLDMVWFAAATGLLLLTWAVEIWIWRFLLQRLGGNLPLSDSARIWFQSAIVRYIPGNVWQPLSLTFLCHRHGIRAETTMASVIIYQVITLLGTAPIAGLYFLLESDANLHAVLGVIPRWLPAGLSLLPLLIFLINPTWLMHLLNWLLRKVRRDALSSTLTRGTLFSAFLVTVLNWIMWGATFALLAFSLGDYARGQLLELGLRLTVIYPVAYAIGFISFFTPSGFGVREGALMLFLAPYLPVAVITVIALAMRLWTMAGELILAGLAALWERRIAAAAHTAANAPLHWSAQTSTHSRRLHDKPAHAHGDAPHTPVDAD